MNYIYRVLQNAIELLHRWETEQAENFPAASALPLLYRTHSRSTNTVPAHDEDIPILPLLRVQPAVQNGRTRNDHVQEMGTAPSDLVSVPLLPISNYALSIRQRQQQYRQRAVRAVAENTVEEAERLYAAIAPLAESFDRVHHTGLHGAYVSAAADRAAALSAAVSETLTPSGRSEQIGDTAAMPAQRYDVLWDAALRRSDSAALSAVSSAVAPDSSVSPLLRQSMSFDTLYGNGDDLAVSTMQTQETMSYLQHFLPAEQPNIRFPAVKTGAVSTAAEEHIYENMTPAHYTFDSRDSFAAPELSSFIERDARRYDSAFPLY